MYKLIIISLALFAFILISCGDDTTTNNPPVQQSAFSGDWKMIVSNIISNSEDTVYISVSNTGSIGSFNVQSEDNNGIPLTAVVNGSVSNDTNINFSAAINYHGQTFNNVISGGNVASCLVPHCFRGVVKLENVIIGTFSGELSNNYAYVGMTMPEYTTSLRFYKIIAF